MCHGIQEGATDMLVEGVPYCQKVIWYLIWHQRVVQYRTARVWASTVLFYC